MFLKFKNLILNEIFYLIISLSVILMLVIARGIFFDDWYKDWQKIALAGGIIYLVTVLFRFFSWTGRKGRKGRRKKSN